MARAFSLLRSLLLPLALLCAAPAAAQPAVQQRVEAMLAEAGPGPRFGLLVTDEAGRELIAIEPDGRFIPASNTKLLTTAAAYATMSGLDQPDAAGGASVRLEGDPRAPDVILTGYGDARLSSAPDCAANCLATLADAVAARTRIVGNIVGDASRFADERWSPGMSWNNIQTRSGTAVAALSLDDNELALRVAPGAGDGAAPALAVLPYYRIVSQVTTAPVGARTQLDVARLPGGNDLYITGLILADAEPVTLRLSLDDPAHYAATRLQTLLEARGVRVTGWIVAAHRLPMESAPAPAPAPLARLTPPPLAEDIVRINKESQNLHAELLLRRLGLARGDGSIEGGVAAVAAMMDQAGAPRTGWDLSDGSGMSTYNRLSPRATVALLRWAAGQPWGATWRATLPVAGVDGTLANRFRGTALAGRLFAKTGTLNASNALSGYLVAASGRTLTFSFFANDMPGGASATARMDAVLVAIAAAN